MKIKRWLQFPFLLNVFVILPFLAICLVPFISSGAGWIPSTLGLGFPYLLLLIILFLVFWLLYIKIRLANIMLMVNVLVLILSMAQIKAVIGFHFFANDKPLERAGDIRVMSWNVSGWDIRSWDLKNHQTDQPFMFDLIEQVNPDVMLFQEFFNCTKPSIVVSYIDLLSKRGYPYYYFSPSSITVSGYFQSGLAIFSRYPLVDTVFVDMKGAGHSEGYQYADVTIEGKKYRLFNTHLESAGLNADDINAVGKVNGSGTIINKLRNSHQVRQAQAKELKQKMNESPHPVIFGGDVDDVPNSTVYFYLRKGLQDAFIKKGSGLGRTFRFVAPNLRIDYLFFSENFTVNKFFEIPKNFSAHYPIVADISE